MKILKKWMQNKLYGRNKHNLISPDHDMVEESRKEEFSDWPQELLAIGTFGNSNYMKGNPEKSTRREDDQDLTPEQVVKLEDELNSVLHQQIGLETPSLPVDSVVRIRGKKDVCLDNSKKAISQKSLSFLLKKMFVCRSGFASTYSLRDPLPESRMEKILRTILEKKIYAQSCSTPPTMCVRKRQYLVNTFMNKDNTNQSKWVKTDSEYIVLEI